MKIRMRVMADEEEEERRALVMGDLGKAVELRSSTIEGKSM